MMRLALCILALMATPLFAQVKPVSGAGDPRLQTVRYDPDQVVQLTIAPGFQLMVRFAAGERIETIAVGDSAAWQVTASKRADVMFIKNIDAAGMTNLTVVSDARTYNFELMPGGQYGGDFAYVVRFIYGDPAVPLAEATTSPPYRYRVSGSRSIRPLRVYPEGSQTFVEWRPESPLPAIYEERDGEERLVNGEMRDGRYAVTGAPQKLVFRLDRLKAVAARTAAAKERP